MTRAAGSFALSMLGIDSAKAVVGTIIANFDEARQSAYQAARMVNDYRESLLELSALKGKMGLGGTTETVKEEIAFRSQTLQKAEESKKYQTMALGTGQSSVNAGLISQDEFTKAMVYGGKMQAVSGADPAAMGALTGLTPSMMGRKTNAKEVAARTQQYFDTFQLGGAEAPNLVKQFNALSSLAVSGVYDDRQLAGLLSAFSTSKPEGSEAKTVVEQFTRATLGGIDATGKPRIQNAENRDEYLTKLGVTDEFLKQTKASDQPFKIADLVAEDLEKQREAQGPSFNPVTYLKKAGYGNQEDVGALIQYAGLKKTGQLKQFMDVASPEKAKTFEQAMAPVERTQQTSPEFQQRKAALAGDLAQTAVGAGQNEYLESLRRLAFARRKAGVGFGGAAEVETDESYETTRDRSMFNPAEMLFQHRLKTQVEADALLKQEARRVGVPGYEKFDPESDEYKLGIQTTLGDEGTYRLAQEVAKHGGNVLPGYESVQSKAATSLDASAAFENLQKTGGVKPAPAAAVPDMAVLPPPAVLVKPPAGSPLDASGTAVVTPAMEAPVPTPAAAGSPAAGVPGADSKEALGVLKDVRDELRKANAKPADKSPPAPLPSRAPSPFR